MPKGYKFAVEWIAANDSPGDEDPVEILQGLVTVALVADLFEKEQAKVAQDVWDERQKGKLKVVRTYLDIFALDELMMPSIQRDPKGYFYAHLWGMHTRYNKGPFVSMDAAENHLSAYVKGAFNRQLQVSAQTPA